MKATPLGDRILVKRVEVEQKKSGIIIKADPNIDVVKWIREHKEAGDFDFLTVNWPDLLHIEELEIDDKFNAGTNMVGLAIHETYQFQLAEGMHTIKAISKIGGAVLEEQFEISGTQWAIIGYEYSTGRGPDTPQKHFGFLIQDEPIRFQ